MTPLDVRSLALFRIAIGLLLISDLSERLLHIELYGVHTRYSLGAGDGLLAQKFFLVALMIAAGCYLAGYKTKLANVVTWVMVVILHNFQPVILNGGDKLLRLFLFWSLFLPVGKRFSADSRNSVGDETESTDAPLMISLALMIQVACPYITSALWKLNTNHWQDGWGLYFSFTRDDEAKALGLWLAGLPLSILKVLNFSVLALELLSPLLMFSWRATERVRLALVLVFLSFHLGMFLTLDVGRFTFICSTGMLALIPASVWGARVPLPEKSRIWIRGAADYFILAVIGLMIIWNIESLPFFERWIPQPVRQAVSLIGLNQKFKMYSGVREEGGWFTMPGRLADGTWIDLFKGGEPLDKERPKIISETFGSEHWRKLIERTTKSRDRRTMSHMAEYYCRWWNKTHDGDKRLVTFTIAFTHQSSFRNGTRSTPQEEELFTQECP